MEEDVSREIKGLKTGRLPVLLRPRLGPLISGCERSIFVRWAVPRALRPFCIRPQKVDLRCGTRSHSRQILL